MATRPSEQWEMIERWKAEHPELAGGVPAAPAPRSRPRLAPAPPPPPPAPREDQREMIERWRREHPELVGNRPAPPPRVVPDRSQDATRRYFDIGDTPLTVLAAFIVGCILGGIAMTVITGIAFWGFSGN